MICNFTRLLISIIRVIINFGVEKINDFKLDNITRKEIIDGVTVVYKRNKMVEIMFQMKTDFIPITIQLKKQIKQ